MKDLAHYEALPYVIELLPEEDGGFTALHPELPGCVAWGDGAEEAVANLAASRSAWIEGTLASGGSIPEPADEETSGRITLRLPRDLHRSLTRRARREGVSLNTYIVSALSASDVAAELRSIVDSLEGLHMGAPNEALGTVLEFDMECKRTNLALAS
jgi:predicted RNase H-like HicB family nuclease